MDLERIKHIPEEPIPNKVVEKAYETEVEDIYHELEAGLKNNDFELANEQSVSHMLDDNSLFCRSESLTRVLDMLENGDALEIHSKNGTANICAMSGGTGFKIAMTEGISKIERDKFVKVILSFAGEHLESRERIDKDDSLWEFKPETAKVSFSGEGTIAPEDIRMISVRYPVRYFPEEEFTEEEKTKLEEAAISFIVRHYIKNKEKTTH